jgi:hypothetical protein
MKNCRPGDIAYVAGSATGLNFGKVVKVVRHACTLEVITALRSCGIDAVAGMQPPTMWFVDPPLTARCMDTLKTAEIPYALDEYLRPIRDPGDDAVDEMVAKLGPAEKSKEREALKQLNDYYARVGEMRP